MVTLMLEKEKTEGVKKIVQSEQNKLLDWTYVA